MALEHLVKKKKNKCIHTEIPSSSVSGSLLLEELYIDKEGSYWDVYFWCSRSLRDCISCIASWW